MPGLDGQHSSILLKNNKSGNFDEIDNVKKIKDRSFLRVRGRNGSGIPMPGQKKSPPANKAQSKISHPKTSTPPNTNSKIKSGFGLKSNLKSKINGNLQKTDTNNNKNGAIRQIGTESPSMQIEESPLNSLHGSGGHGLGGGSVAKTGFSYHLPGVAEAQNDNSLNSNNNNHSNDKPREVSPPTRSLKPPSQITSPANKKTIPGSKSKLSLLRPKAGKNSPKTTSSSSGNDSSTTDAKIIANPTTEKTGIKPPVSSKPKPTVPAKSKSLLTPKSFHSKTPKKLSLLTPPSSNASSYSIKSHSFAAINTQYGKESVHDEPMEKKATINRLGSGRTFGNKQRLIPVGIPKVPQMKKTTLEADEKQLNESLKQPETNIQNNVAQINTSRNAAVRCPTPVNVQAYVQLSIEETQSLTPQHPTVPSEPHLPHKNNVQSTHSNQSNVEVDTTSNEPVNVMKYASAFENREKSINQTRSASPISHSHKIAKIPTSNLVLNMVRKCSTESFEPESISAGDSLVTPDEGKIDLEEIKKDDVLKSSLAKIGSENSVTSSDSTSSASSIKPNHHKKVSFQNDVMVREGYGDSTYVERLKSKSTDDVNGAVPVAWDSSRTVAEQLGISASEEDYKEYIHNRNHGRDFYDEHDNFGERKSAVAAAIETITGKSSSSGRSTPRMLSKSQITVNEPPLRNSSTPYKENWYPPKQRLELKVVSNHNMPNSLPQDSYSAAIMAVGPSPTLSYSHMSHPEQGIVSNSQMTSAFDHSNTPAISRESIHADPSPYFQTQSGFPFQNTEINSKWQSEGTPYYECTNWTNRQTMPLDGNEENSNRQTQQTAETKHANMEELQKPANEHNTATERVKVMEAKLDSLAGVVENYISQSEKPTPPPLPKKPTENISKSRQDDEDLKSGKQIQRSKENKPSTNMPDEVKRQILSLKTTAKEMRLHLDEIKRQQRRDMEALSELIMLSTQQMTQMLTSTAGAEQRPIRARRVALDNERQSYQNNAAQTERQLTDVEAAVEELRNEVVERRCRVNAKEVEALALQLSHAGRTIADLKGSFPKLCEELRAVGSAETEVVIQEEKFIDAEPTRLDEQLKRCKQVTATLFTLKKLANVQEARSKTPVHIQPGGVGRPETPSQYLTSLSLSLHGSQPAPPTQGSSNKTDVKKMVLDEIRRQNVNSQQRMQSLKALELAEKALRPTTNAKDAEDKRQRHLVNLYQKNKHDQRQMTKSLSTPLSASSSLESLPSPPPPRMTNIKPNVTAGDHKEESLGSTALSPPSSITCASSTSSIATNLTSENCDQPDHPNFHAHYRPHATQHQRNLQQPNHRQTPQHSGYYNLPEPHTNQVYRSNSLQRQRGRGSQLQQYDQQQKQRSRTPNPNMSYEHYGYSMQMPSVQYDNAYYAQQQQQQHYVNYNNNMGYISPNAQYEMQQMNNQMRSPQFIPQQMRGVGRTQSQKVMPTHLRKPTQYMRNSPTPHQQKQHNEEQLYYQEQQNGEQFAEKSNHLKEQYNKLQQMQKKQRSDSSRLKKKIPPSQRKPPSRSQTPTMINTSAKSSDV